MVLSKRQQTPSKPCWARSTWTRDRRRRASSCRGTCCPSTTISTRQSSSSAPSTRLRSCAPRRSSLSRLISMFGEVAAVTRSFSVCLVSLLCVVRRMLICCAQSFGGDRPKHTRTHFQSGSVCRCKAVGRGYVFYLLYLLRAL